jgi:hypothetical protein
MAKLVIGDREFDSQEAFIRGGRRCGTPELNEFQKERVRAHLRTARANGMDAAAVTRLEIPVHFHVIHDGQTGALSDQELEAQLNVLNDSFKPHDIVFTRASVDRTDDPVWFRMTMNSAAERKAKTKLGKEQHRALNFYTAGIGAGLLGWATFPTDLAGDPARDGVVVLYSTLPGGSTPKYDLGLSAAGRRDCGHAVRGQPQLRARQPDAEHVPERQRERPDHQLHGLHGRRRDDGVLPGSGRPDQGARHALPA